MPRQGRVAQRRRVDDAVAHDEDVLAGAFADQAVHVQRNAFRVAVGVGFHADELGVHVVGAGLGERGHGVGREAVPTGDADVGAVAARHVFPPGEVGDVDLDGRALGADADLAVAAQHDGPDVAGRDAVGFDGVDHRGAELVERVGNGDAVDLGGVDQALHVLGQAKHRRALRLGIAADAFKDAGPVMNDVAHHVDGGLFPRDEVAVMPDF